MDGVPIELWISLAALAGMFVLLWLIHAYNQAETRYTELSGRLNALHQGRPIAEAQAPRRPPVNRPVKKKVKKPNR